MIGHPCQINFGAPKFIIGHPRHKSINFGRAKLISRAETSKLILPPLKFRRAEIQNLVGAKFILPR
jgi:hypothetical protein